MPTEEVTTSTRKKSIEAARLAAPPAPTSDHLAGALQADSIRGPKPAETAPPPPAVEEEQAPPAPVVAAPPPVVAAPPPEIAAAPPRPAHKPDPFGQGPGKLITTPLREPYRGEEVGKQGPGAKIPTEFNLPGTGTVALPSTAYAPDAAHHAAPIRDGRIHFGGAGQSPDAPADSSKNKRAWDKDKDQQFNYAMDPHGGLKLSDPHKEMIDAVGAPDAEGKRSGQRINHSTMLAGGDAAGAGTMKVNQGKVEELTDSSGHYRPLVTQTAQVASTLAQQGALDPARSTVELTGKKKGEKELRLTAQELLAYEGDPTKKWGRAKDAPALAPAPPRLRPQHAAPSEARQKLDQSMAGRGAMYDPPVSLATAREKFAETGDRAHLTAPEDAIRLAHKRKDRVLKQIPTFDQNTLQPAPLTRPRRSKREPMKPGEAD